ncbi:hypothetical protein CAEBREN_00470 [Caenorhabditis brenneri]|uniref:Uncharacterized protein n=1 Tax=Caenorhabditis brenneri TaxID=135651 RepID=G0MUT3_CAEBE|nr:hypothetical protein CAEBREN_00470 [Caenorhabditis brenneri]
MSAGGGGNESESSATSSSKSSDTVPPFTEIQIIEVNRNNFSKIWPYLLVCIESADFTAMDLELSGLGGPKLRSKDVQERYKSIREAAHTGSILSVGITTMKLIRKSEKRRSLRYETRIFNILTLSEKPFTIEPSALQFLAKHSFDFNRLIQSGVQIQGKNCSLKTLFHEFLGSSATLCLHNGFVDLAFLYKQMYDVDLPETLDEFVNNLSDLFPDDYLPIADSKYLAEFQTRYKSSYLEYVFRRTQGDNEIERQARRYHIEIDFSTNENVSKSLKEATEIVDVRLPEGFPDHAIPIDLHIHVIEVNRNNFSKIWPCLLVCIKSADFTAMDLELSGLGGPGLRSKDVQERYKSIQEAAHTRSIFFVGIIIMKLIRKIKTRRSLRYETRIFNILTLSEKPFTIEPSALQFLAKHSFDFNRLIQSGVQFQGKNCPLKTLFHEFLGSSATLCLHNGFVDLAFLYKQNYDVDLSETLDEFVNNRSTWKSIRHDTNPRIWISGRVDTWQITFYWLPIFNEEVIQKVVGDDEWNLRHVTQLYENEEKWRSVTVETVFKPEVDEIFSQMNSILQARDSSIYKAFSHSSFGSLSPAASADLALMESVEGGTILSPTDTPSQPKNSSNGGNIRKMSKIFMSSVMGRKPSQ